MSIRTKDQIRKAWRDSERRRRMKADENSVQALTLPEIESMLETPFSKEELRAERKRRMERLRYARIMENPFTRSQYREHKRNYRQSVKEW